MKDQLGIPKEENHKNSYQNMHCTKIVKFLNQCFAQLRYWKSVCTAVTVGFVNSRHFSNIVVAQNTDLRI